MEKVFLATLGTSPAVVTETLWALARRDPPWRPDRIEIVTTGFGAGGIARDLLRPGGPLTTLYAPDPVPPVTIHVPLPGPEDGAVASVIIRWLHGDHAPVTTGDLTRAAPDVAVEADANLMGDLILDRIYAVTRVPGNQLHLSISGGRKTMSAHALFSLGLVGNPQDEASHVLIGAAFDLNRQFWHPQQGGLIHTMADQRAMQADPDLRLPATLDPATAADSLRLLSIAAPRYDAFPNRRSAGAAPPRLSRILAEMNLAAAWLRNPTLTLDPATNQVTLAGITRQIDHMDFVWLRCLATAARDEWTSPHDPQGQAPGAVSVLRLLSGAPEFGRLKALKRSVEQAIAVEADSADKQRNWAGRRSGFRSSWRTHPKGPLQGGNLGAAISNWLSHLNADPAQFDETALSCQTRIGAELERYMKSFTPLRDELALTFGTGLARALLPGRQKGEIRSGKVQGFSTAAFVISGLPGAGVRIGGES